MATLTSALEHYRRQQRITARALIEARRARPRGPFAVASVVAAYQLLAARDAVDSIPPMLAEQGIPDQPVGTVAITALAGIASDGRALDTLFAQAQNVAQLGLMVVTQVQDAARVAASVGINVRPEVTGYVRMLNPPSCSRCAVLAGRFYRKSEGFERHPRCDCRHIPTGDAQMARELGLIDDPTDYFDRLPTAEQDRIFTKAGAQAIRDGADIGQVVNARRWMQTANVGGRRVLTSTEGTTRRGIASRARTGRKMSQRLMPESIYAIAEDHADVLRLLRLHGYIF